MVENTLSRRQLLAATGATTFLAGCSAIGGTDSSSTTRDSGNLTGEYQITEFVQREGSTLTLDGDPYRFTGMMGLLTHTELGQKWSDRTIALASEHDITVYRCWGFPAPWDSVSATHQAPGEFNDTWFEAFDYTVARAKEAGVRLIVPLLQGVQTDAGNDRLNYAPSPAAYGSWSDTADYTSNPGAFIDDEQANEYFKEHIEYFLTRENQYTGVEYRNEPTILLWECANELEYKSGETAGDSIADWYSDISSYIKSIDSNHLVSTGMHGSMGEIYEPWTERCAFVEDHQVDEIDVCTFHDYPIREIRQGVNIRSPDLAARYAAHKIRLAHDEVGKPVYCGEYGTPLIPDVDRAYVTRIETAEEAGDIENNREFPMAFPKQHDDGVLVTRPQEIDGIDLTDRNEYFQNLTGVAAKHAMDGSGFWRVGPNTAGENASEKQSRQHRIKHNDLIIYPRDEETFAVMENYHRTVVE